MKKASHPVSRHKVILIAVVAFTSSVYGFRFEDDQLSQGQTIYVSVYSNIFTSPRGVSFPLDATLVIRNTDMSNALNVTTVDLYDTDGKLLKHFADTPSILQPLQTKYICLPEKESAGGLGANFIVRWTASREINAPVVECLMLGTRSGQGISFMTFGKMIKEHSR
jgi:hypothetical protein